MFLVYFLVFYGRNARYSLKYIAELLVHNFIILYNKNIQFIL
jgi:hypothetical protein